jgi:hypothetical protein
MVSGEVTDYRVQTQEVTFEFPSLDCQVLETTQTSVQREVTFNKNWSYAVSELYLHALYRIYDVFL